MGESHARNRLSVGCGECRKRQVPAARDYGSSDRASGHTGSAATTACTAEQLQHLQGGGETEQRDLAV